jgi:RNAse (barnase) inhibitor barstar
MKFIELDASKWKTTADFYEDLLDALGAPDWHGENLDALWESIVDENINEVSPPFEIRISSTEHLPDVLRAYLRQFEELIVEARAEGVTVLVEFSPPLW